jgi:hypothetical protein
VVVLTAVLDAIWHSLTAATLSEANTDLIEPATRCPICNKFFTNPFAGYVNR